MILFHSIQKQSNFGYSMKCLISVIIVSHEKVNYEL